MKTSTLRWTLLLTGALTALSAAAALFRSGAEEEAPAVRRPPAKTMTYSGTSEPAAEDPIAELVAVPEPPARPAPESRAPVERRKARDEGYQEARQAAWEGALSGQVMSSEGPLANFAVSVEWVLAHEPGREEIARLKRVRARRDRDGTWWAKALAMTDESGCFVIEGLPAVPLRLHAGSATQKVQVGGFAQIRTERP